MATRKPYRSTPVTSPNVQRQQFKKALCLFIIIYELKYMPVDS